MISKLSKISPSFHSEFVKIMCFFQKNEIWLKKKKKESFGIYQVKVYFLCVFIIFTNSLKECSRLQFNMDVGGGRAENKRHFCMPKGEGEEERYKEQQRMGARGEQLGS